MKLFSSIFKHRPDDQQNVKTAILGDIHANIEALDAVLADMEQLGVTQRVCTGDIVDYGADPLACTQRLMELNVLTVKGNHDLYCVDGLIPHGINPTILELIHWTRNQLPNEESDWLKALPKEAKTGPISVAHSSFEPGNGWPYILDAQQAKPSLSLQSAQLGFYGHTHRPIAFIQNRWGKVNKKKFDTLRIKPGHRYLLNPGSVGQPRDGDPRAAYALYDPAERTVTLRRVEYDIRTTASKIRKAGLPLRNAERLSLGK